jgi:hypothetical protein
MGERAKEYTKSLWENKSGQEIPRLFTQFCGVPDSDTVHRLGWSLFQVRGDSYGRMLKTVKIV